ncbi:MAG TPA: hypothetical protein VFV51_16795 [Vicinamibacterales bacterium]|nr:hypothetical protein [Vicinamibacterales bacterium]
MNAVARADYEREIDLALSASFPASDPLPWTFGVSREATAVQHNLSRPRAAVTDVIVGHERYGHRARAIAEVFGFAALVPIAILLAGVPIAAVVQALLSVLR